MSLEQTIPKTREVTIWATEISAARKRSHLIEQSEDQDSADFYAIIDGLAEVYRLKNAWTTCQQRGYTRSQTAFVESKLRGVHPAHNQGLLYMLRQSLKSMMG